MKWLDADKPTVLQQHAAKKHPRKFMMTDVLLGIGAPGGTHRSGRREAELVLFGTRSTMSLRDRNAVTAGMPELSEMLHPPVETLKRAGDIEFVRFRCARIINPGCSAAAVTDAAMCGYGLPDFVRWK